MLAHVLVDVVAIAALTLLAVRGLVPGLVAAVGILAVQGAYVLQLNRSRGPHDPQGPTGALIGLLWTLAGIGRRILG